MTHARDLIRQAYDLRSQGDLQGSLMRYGEARGICREDSCRAHCLRHEGDILRELGRIAEAETLTRQAEALYRQMGDDPLALANTLRILALINHRPDLWREARDLYAKTGVEAGVAECDAQLAL